MPIYNASAPYLLSVTRVSSLYAKRKLDGSSVGQTIAPFAAGVQAIATAMLGKNVIIKQINTMLTVKKIGFIILFVLLLG